MGDEALGSAMVRAIAGHDDYRLLRRLELRTGRTGVGSSEDTVVGVAVDVETTSLGDDDAVIELALRRFCADRDGVVVAVDEPHAWLEDPGRELPADVVRLTGLTDADLAGKRIDDEAAVELLRSARFVAAHNSRFDRPRVERRLPGAAGLAWACSCMDVNWRAAGFDGGRGLGWLLAQVGWFHGAHRAGDDVDAVIALLGHTLPTGRTVLAEMLERARAPSWRFRAVGAAFEVKDLLKGRGYRWDGDGAPKCWWREVPDAEREAEAAWLARHVYAPEARPRVPAPIVTQVTWWERYA